MQEEGAGCDKMPCVLVRGIINTPFICFVSCCLFLRVARKTLSAALRHLVGQVATVRSGHDRQNQRRLRGKRARGQRIKIDADTV